MKIYPVKSALLKFAAGLVVLTSLGGCAHYQVDFGLTDSNFKPKGTSIAVISGTKEPMNVTMAKLVGDSLRKQSRYQVVSAAQISKVIDPYPQTIKGPYKSAYFYIDSDWDLSDKQKIASIQRALGVDYLYVIWAPITISTNGSEMRRMPAVAQMFEQPNAKEVAKTTITLMVGDEGSVYMKEGVEEIARQIAEETKMALAGKK